MADADDNSTNHIDSADILIQQLGARYLIVLALVALLMVVDQSVVQPLLVRLDAYAPAINLAGRQRMLSQKLTKAALALQASGNDTARSVYRAEMRETLEQWSAAQDALLSGDSQRGIWTIQSPDISAQWEVLLPHFKSMRAAATRLIDLAEGHVTSSATTQAVGQIAAHEAAFLSAMDRIVNLMETKAADEINRLRGCALAIAGAVMILLAGLGWFVVRPATQTIRHQVDGLESRIAQRTCELAEALASLRRQIAERAEVESKNKALAARLSHADRVASMGHLSIGLAHELNQPLGAIANYAEVCDLILSQPLEAHKQMRLQDNVNHIKQASLRAGQIVRRIRNYVKPSPSTIAEADVNILVQEVVALCGQEIIQARVELTLELAAEGGIVAVDPIQIQQVLVNLLQNALHSMDGCAAGDRRLSIRTSCNFDTVQIDLLDSGHGFAASDAETIFDPFYTTKGDGLGIGLAICRAIIGNYDGTIWAESKAGNGARISFTLPITRPHNVCRAIESDCVCG